MNRNQIPTVKKMKPFESNTSSEDLFSFKRQSLQDQDSNTINTSKNLSSLKFLKNLRIF